MHDGIERNGQQLDPLNADTDGDGILDGTEDRNQNGLRDRGELSPARADTDGDGIPDGVEDRNQNGIWDDGETDGTQADTDGDGIPDGIEDQDRDGEIDVDETNPLSRDSDQDGLTMASRMPIGMGYRRRMRRPSTQTAMEAVNLTVQRSKRAKTL